SSLSSRSRSDTEDWADARFAASRAAPSSAEVISHRLISRSPFVRQGTKLQEHKGNPDRILTLQVATRHGAREAFWKPGYRQNQAAPSEAARGRRRTPPAETARQARPVGAAPAATTSACRSR